MSIRLLASLVLSVCALACATQPAPRLALDPAPIAILEQQDADSLFRAQKWSEAAEIYAERTVADPADAQSWYRLGYCLHALGRLDEAIVAHEKASRLPPTQARGAYNLACAYALLGQLDPAFEALDRALAAGFRDVPTLETDADLETLRRDPRYASRAARLGVTLRDASFDFWLGEWEVFDPSGNLIGRNVITSVERGFVLQENWTDSSGRTGRSLNFVDPEDGQWKQVWIDDRGAVVRYSGAWNGSAMALSGSRTVATGKSVPTRCTFTPAEDGSVRQVIEDPDPSGAFRVTFDGTYRRRSR